MPLAKIHVVLEGQYDEARLGKVSSAVQNGLASALGIPPEGFFQIVYVLPKSQFRHTPSFLGLNYSDDLTCVGVHVHFRPPQGKEIGTAEGLERRRGLSSPDLSG